MEEEYRSQGQQFQVSEREERRWSVVKCEVGGIVGETPK